MMAYRKTNTPAKKSNKAGYIVFKLFLFVFPFEGFAILDFMKDTF